MSDEYEHQSYWTKLNQRLNEEQEATLSDPICFHEDEKGNCLMSVRFTMMDFSSAPKPPFCETVKNENRKT